MPPGLPGPTDDGARKAAQRTIMPQWEYTKLDLNNVPAKSSELDVLDDAGKDGWELVGITANNCAYLKRAVPEPEAPAKSAATRRKATSS
jgi:hypothetical protein